MLFLVLSFFSIANVYGVDNEIVTSSDTVTADNLDYNSEFVSEPIQNISNETNSSGSFNVTTDTKNSGGTVNNGADSNSYNVGTVGNPSVARPLTPNDSLSNSEPSHEDNENHFNDNYKNSDVYYLRDNGDNLYKISEKSTNLDTIDYSSFYSIFQDYNSNYNSDNYEGYYNDINDHKNNYIVLLISHSNSNLNGQGNGNSNNLIKKVTNLNFNRVDNDEDASTIWDFQSCPKPIFTILLFIKIFMEHHDNGKEHLNSF